SDGGRGRHARPPLLRPRDRPRKLRRSRTHERSRMTRKRIAFLAVCALTLVFVGVAWAGVSSSKGTRHATGVSAVSGSISFDGIWTAGEAKAFGAVIAAFNKKFPKVKVNYKPVGNNLPTILATAIAGGRPPDMADIAQPGTLKQYALGGK